MSRQILFSSTIVDAFNDNKNSCRIKQCHSSYLINKRQLYTFFYLFDHNRITAPPFSSSSLPLTQHFHYVAPSFHCLRLKLQGRNKWLRWHTERPSVNIARGDLGTQRSAAPSSSTQHPVLFKAFPLKDGLEEIRW